jgi:hypothetical protein
MSSAAGTSPRAVLLDPDEQRVIEEQRARRLHSLAHREVWSFALFAGGFLTVAILMAALLPSQRSPGAGAVLVLIGAYAAAFRLDFEIGSGSAVPTQLILVPMLFVLPTGYVPLAVAAGIVALETMVERLADDHEGGQHRLSVRLRESDLAANQPRVSQGARLRLPRQTRVRFIHRVARFARAGETIAIAR